MEGQYPEKKVTISFAVLWIPDTGRVHDPSSVAAGLQAQWNYTTLMQQHAMMHQDIHFETLWHDGPSFRVPSSDCHLNILILERTIKSIMCNYPSSDSSHAGKPIVLKLNLEAILKTDFG